MAYKTIQYGSSGEEVKTLQTELNKRGYKLDVDGKFGPKTQAAVKDYQKKNNLAVDGIVGRNTWGSLTSSGKPSNKTKASSEKKKANTSSTASARPTYEKSNAVKDEEKKLEDWENNAPGAYESKYSPEIDSILNDILNREAFSYNLNADPLYQQYKESYTQDGKKAMMDTVGAASALTGGYASSYAVSAGNQAYHEHLNQLNDVALDLRDRAYQQYGDEGDRLFEEVKLLRSLDGDAYDRYLDDRERYYKDGEYILERLTTMSDAEFEQFLQTVDAWESDRDFAFRQEQEANDREEFDEEMEFKRAEADRDQANKDREYERARSSSSSGDSGSSGSKEKKASETINYPTTYKEFCAATGYAGIMTETEYYAHNAVSKKYGSYEDYLKAMFKLYK